jgi:hypothetical protein
LAAAACANLDRACWRIRSRADCCFQAARKDTLVPLWFHLHPDSVASDCAADDPYPPCPTPRNIHAQRRADALDLLADRSVRSYPSWIADLKRKSPDGIDRRRYAYEHIRPGEALELVRELANRRGDRAVAYRHRGIRVGYVPKRQRWIAEAMEDGLCLAAVAVKVKTGWIAGGRAKFVGTRIIVLNDGRKR